MSEAPVASEPQKSTHIEISTPQLSSSHAASSQQTSLDHIILIPQHLQTNHSYDNTKKSPKSVYETDAVQEIENVYEVGNIYNTNIPVHETYGKERYNDKLYASAAAGTAAPTRICLLYTSPSPRD